MEPKLSYTQHPGRATEDVRFSHMMALTLDPTSAYKHGIIRCIVSRKGDVAVAGFVDRSQLHQVHGDTLESFSIGGPLQIEGQEELIKSLADPEEGWDFIGLEDPDIWVDETTGLLHVYFTIPIRHTVHHTAIALGHAVGIDLNTLRMTKPTLLPRQLGGKGNGAKELSVAPINSKGVRFNLIESADRKSSIVQIAVAEHMDVPWEYGKIVFHPKEHHIPWIGGHASPGPLLPKMFYDPGEHKLLGIINGRETNRRVGKKTHYGTFSVGLFIYDYEEGKIDWVSPEPFIRDSEARTITFASLFVETGKGEGILYAHVDDSFVRAYTVRAED